MFIEEEINLPEGIVEEFQLAKHAYYTYEERVRLRGERAIQLLPSFLRAFDQIIIAASSDEPELIRRALLETDIALRDVISRCREGASPPNFPSNHTIYGEVVLPKDVVGLYHLTKDATLNYGVLTKERDSLRLPLFMTAFDHIVGASQSEAAARLGFLANAKEYLLRTASETYEEATLELLSRIRKAGLSRIYKQFIFLWRNPPSVRYIEARVAEISDLLIEARLLAGNTARASNCIDRMKRAYEIAWKLNEELRQRSINRWVWVVGTLLIGSAGSLLAWGILKLWGIVKPFGSMP